MNEIRREGSFVYESFVETQGTDVKVGERCDAMHELISFSCHVVPCRGVSSRVAGG